MTIKESIQLFINHCKYEKNLSEKTIEAYKIDLSQLFKFLGSDVEKKIENLDKTVIRQYLQELSKYEAKTIKRKIATIKAMLNFLEYEDYILINPFRKMKISIKEKKQLPSIMTNKDVKSIFKVVYDEKNKITNKKGHAYLEKARDLAVLELLFATGIRVSELCSLKQSDIDLKSGNVLILGKGNKERIIQVCHKETKLTLKEYLHLFESRMKSEYFFINKLNRQLSDQSVRFMIKKYYQKAGIKKHITPHTFRHTFATLLLEENVDIKYIQHFLGHSSIATTQIYTHVNKVKQKKILSTKHPRLKFTLDADS